MCGPPTRSWPIWRSGYGPASPASPRAPRPPISAEERCMNILGISAFYHDSAAAIVVEGNLVAAAQEERFTRKKHDPDFPRHAVVYCLEAAGLSPDQIDFVAFYDKPMLKFE